MKIQSHPFHPPALLHFTLLTAFFALALSAAAAPGDYDTTFDPKSTVTSGVSAVVVQPDGKILVGGTFTNIGGDDDYICRLNADGTLDTSFDPMDLLNARVFAIALQPDGKILVGGMFTDAGGDDDYICRLNADGTHDTNFDPDDLVNSWVRCIVIRPDGKIFIGGQFTAVGGSDDIVSLLNANGTRDTSFNPGSKLSGSAYTMARQPDGKLIVGGVVSVDGEDESNICRLNADGSYDTSFDPKATFNGFVHSAVLRSDGKVLVGGNFTDAGGDDDYICRLNADGTHDAGFDPKFTIGSAVESIALQANGRVLVAGDFDDAPGGTGDDDKVARLLNSGAHDSSFNVGNTFSFDAYGLALQGDGALLVGGLFFDAPAGTGDDDRMSRLHNDASTGDLTVPSNSEALWTRAGAGPEFTRVQYSSSTDGGTTWVVLGEGTRVVDGWELTGVSIPSAATVRAHGFTSSGESNGSSGIVEATATAPEIPEIPGGGGGASPKLKDTWTAWYNLASYYYGLYASFGDYNSAFAFYSYYFGVGDYYYHLARKNQGPADFALYNGLALFYLYAYSSSPSYYYYLALAYYYYFLGFGDFDNAILYYNAFIAFAS